MLAKYQRPAQVERRGRTYVSEVDKGVTDAGRQR
jgi:hypothetical protein